MPDVDSRGGDNRPSAYYDPDIERWVYRASALGHCERELVALRRGGTAAPTPDWLMRRFNEGHDFEDELLALYSKDNGSELSLTQHQVTIPVGKDAAVRGSMDGYDEKLAAIIDAKFLGPDLYRKLKSQGIAGSSAYKWQQPIYAHGLIAEGYNVERICLAMGLKRYEKRIDPDTGEEYNAAVGVAEMHYEWVDLADLPGLGPIKARVLGLERQAKADADQWPTCPVPFQFPCGFPELHDEVDTAVDLEGDAASKLTVARQLHYAGSELEKAAKKLKADSATAVREVLVDQGINPESKGNKLRANGVIATWVFSPATEDVVVPEQVVAEHTKKGRAASAYPKFAEDKGVGW